MQAAGGAYAWLERLFHPEGVGQVLANNGYPKPEAFSAESGNLLFLPYLIGERSPYWNPDSPWRLDWIGPCHTAQAEFARAVLEGVAF